MTDKTLAFASDHAGFALKKRLMAEVCTNFPDLKLLDLGTDSESSVDYPDFGYAAAAAVRDGKARKAVIICGSGIGISIAANRMPEARAALCWNAESATLARQHNNANILALSARLVPEETSIAALHAFLKTPFEGGRHEKRVEKLGACKI